MKSFRFCEKAGSALSFRRKQCYTDPGGLLPERMAVMELMVKALLDLSHSVTEVGLAGFQYPWEALDGIRGLGGSGGGTGRRDGAGGRGLASEVGRMRTAGIPGRRGGG